MIKSEIEGIKFVPRTLPVVFIYVVQARKFWLWKCVGLN